MNDFPKIPNDRTFNQIPDILTVTKRSNEFLQFDSGPGDDLDGTFKVAPSICYQLYAMHIVYRNAVIPIVFALLPNKNQSTYHRLLDKLKELCPLWHPKSIMMDFEKAAMNEFGD
ncbi:unnamed protein product, partial [Rotaria sp. Silwood1]